MKRIAALAIASVFLAALSAVHSADRLSASKLRDGKDVRTAYVSIVASADQATVRILSGGKEAALGTVVDADGYVLTKYSELRDPVTCRLNDGRTVAAKVVGHDPQLDLAMLKVEADKLKTVPWAEGTVDPTWANLSPRHRRAICRGRSAWSACRATKCRPAAACWAFNWNTPMAAQKSRWCFPAAAPRKPGCKWATSLLAWPTN